MNFISSALSSLTGTSIPYTIGEKVSSPLPDQPFSVWTIYDGTDPKKDNSPVTIFEMNLQEPSNVRSDFVSLARNAFKKLKLVKFPSILSIIDYIENDNFIYIISEPVVPLFKYFDTHADRISKDARIAGIYTVAEALAFINTKGNCIHGNLNFYSSVFVNPAGDWKLFGFEVLTNLTSDPDQPIYRLASRAPGFLDNLPDDVDGQGLDSIRQFPFKFDSYKFGVFLYQVLSWTTSSSRTYKVQALQLTSSSAIPKSLAGPFKRLVSKKPNLRINIDKFLAECSSTFENNDLINLSKLLGDLVFENEDKKLQFYKFELPRHFPDDVENVAFPPGFLENKVLPELLTQYQNVVNLKPTVNSTVDSHQQKQDTLSILLNYILKFGCSLPEPKFNKVVKPIILQSFSLGDRSIRLTLLAHLQSYECFLSESDVQSKLFYNLLGGFQDSNYMIRETTLKSITTIIDKISVKQVNQDLLKVLAKSQMDPKPSIRTNTLVLIIKISDKIYANSRNNVLATALAKSLRDTFTPSKLAALSGFETLKDQFTLEDICNKVLGTLAIALMDVHSVKVRTTAKEVFDLYLQVVERHASGLPKTEIDSNAEEEEFFRKHAPAVTPSSDETNNATSGSKTGFGWKIVNKLVSSSDMDGVLNHEFNTSTPDLTRTSSNADVGTTNGLGSQNARPPSVELEVDDGWGFDDEDAEPVVTERVSQTATKNKPMVKSTRKESSLKLGKSLKNKQKPITRLNIKLDDDDDDNDGWNVEDNW